MKQIIRRLLTNNPKLSQTKDLKKIVSCIGEYPQENVEPALSVWHQDTQERLSEKNEKGRWKHERARKAYNSIKKKLSFCYIFAQYPDLHIPQTTNSLESIN